MEIKTMIQSTPNPNALKFVLNVPVKTSGNCTYKRSDNFQYNPLAKNIFEINAAIKEVYFFDNYITVTQDGTVDWEDLESKVLDIIKRDVVAHDPNFIFEEPQKATPLQTLDSPELQKINNILDQTVRPALQMDGGDIQLIDYSNDTLKVFYQGACGSCPSSSMGTLKAIENILKDEFNPNIVVELAETF